MDTTKTQAQTLSDVRAWLRDVYSGQEPEWEETPENLAVLAELRERNLESERVSKVVIGQLETQKQEYIAETQRIKSLLSKVGVHWNDFTPREQAIARSIAELTLVIEAKDVRISSLYAVLSDIAIENGKVAEEHRGASDELEGVLAMTRNGLSRLGQLQRMLESMKESDSDVQATTDEQKRGTDLLNAKAEEYKGQVIDLRESLKKAGMDSSLQHHALSNLAQELSELKASIVEPLRKLESFQDLPPNVELARLKVEETRKELASIEASLQRSVEAMGLSE